MALVGIDYVFCSNRKERTVLYNDSTKTIQSGTQDGEVQPVGTPCKSADQVIYTDGDYVVKARSSLPFAYVENNGPAPPPPPDPGPTCGLAFFAIITTKSSAPGVPDGQISASASDTLNAGLTVRYSINVDVPYPGGVAGTPAIFSGLVPGTYTIYARNQTNCLATHTVVLQAEDPPPPVANPFRVRYRLEFHDLFSVNETWAATAKKWRLDISDREYEGDNPTEVTAGATPAMLDYRGEQQEDVFTPVVASELNVTLVSLTDEQFVDLFTDDERRYRGDLYLYNGSDFVLWWRGFLLPMAYNESYVQKTNYDINLTFIDALANLKDIEFRDINDNIFTNKTTLLTALNSILYKTGIDFDLWESVNIYTAAMDQTNNDSPLTQTKIDPALYLDSDGVPEDCETVLKALMEIMGARIYMAEGHWNVEVVTQKSASSVVVRKYAAISATFLSSATISPRVLVRRTTATAPKVTFDNQSAVLNIPPTYGKVKVTYDLGLEETNNLLVNGQFEEVDLANGQFNGWAISKSSSNVGVGVETLEEPRNGAKKALFVDFSANDPGAWIKLTAQPVAMASATGYYVEVSFDIFSIPFAKETYIYLDHSIRFNTLFANYEEGVGASGISDYRSVLSPLTASTNLIDGEYAREFISNHLTWKTVKFKVRVPKTLNSIDSDGNMILQLLINANPLGDYSSLAALKAVDTKDIIVNRQNPRARLSEQSGGIGVVRFYKLEAGAWPGGTEPEYVRPDNYDVDNNPRYWKQDKSVQDIGQNNWLQNMLITNVQVKYLPNVVENNIAVNIAPLEQIVSETIINSNIKAAYEKTLRHGDITPDIDGNYKFISNAILYDASDNPIAGTWLRKGSTESKLLHQLVSSMYQGQFIQRRRKLSGSVTPDGVTPSFANTFQEIRTGRVFLPMALSMDLKNASHTLEMIETLKGEAVVDEGDPTIPPVEPPVSTNEHTNEFTNEFS